MTTRDPAKKEASTVEKERRKTDAELNKEAAKAHNEEGRRLAESRGPHPGYKTWAPSLPKPAVLPPKTRSMITPLSSRSHRRWRLPLKSRAEAQLKFEAGSIYFPAKVSFL